MAKVPPPPLLVRTLLTRGCMATFSPEGNAFNPEESVALARYLHRLVAARDPASTDTLVDTLAAVAQASQRAYPARQPIACAKGCHFCCYQRVTVNAPEIFTLARRLGQRADVAGHRARLAARADRDGSDPARVLDRTKPCSFLVDQACGLHPIRPLVCRVIVSLDRSACIRRYEAGDGIYPYPASQEPIRLWLLVAFWAAIEAAGLEPSLYDLEGGVEAVLRDPEIEVRWYAGDDGLAAHRRPTHPATVRAEIARLRTLARL